MSLQSINNKVLVVLTILLCLIILSSCSCDWHVKRAKAKCGETATEVVTIHDTIYTKQIQSDTVFKYFVKDSVIVHEGKLIMKYFYNQKDSTVFLQGKCEADTVIKEIKVPFEKTVIKVDYFPKWLMFLVGFMIVAALIYKLVIK